MNQVSEGFGVVNDELRYAGQPEGWQSPGYHSPENRGVPEYQGHGPTYVSLPPRDNPENGPSIGDYLSKSDDLEKRLKSLLADTDNFFDTKPEDYVVEYQPPPQPPPNQYMVPFANGRQSNRPFQFRSRPSPLESVREGREEADASPSSTQTLEEDVAPLAYSISEDYTDVDEQPVKRAFQTSAPLQTAPSHLVNNQNRHLPSLNVNAVLRTSPPPSQTPTSSPVMANGGLDPGGSNFDAGPWPLSSGGQQLSLRAWEENLRVVFSKATHSMSETLGRASAKLRGLEAKLAVVETDTQYATLAIASSWRSRDGEPETADVHRSRVNETELRNLRLVVSNGCKQQESTVMDFEHRLDSTIDRWCRSIQQLNARVALSRLHLRGKKSQVRGGGGQLRELEGMDAGKEEELRVEIARLADVNSQLSRKLSNALKLKMECERLQRENGNLKEQAEALAERARVTEDQLASMREMVEETERLKVQLLQRAKELEKAQALLSNRTGISRGGSDISTGDNMELDFKSQVEILKKELNSQALMISNLRSGTGQEQVLRERYHKLQDDFFEVHRQHLQESSRCASLQRQLSQEKTIFLHKEQQLYHACAQLEMLKEEITALEEKLAESELSNEKLHKRYEAIKGADGGDWQMQSALDEALGGAFGTGKEGGAKQAPREEEAVRVAGLMRARMAEMDEQMQGLRARLDRAERDGQSKVGVLSARDDRVRAVEEKLSEAREEVGRVERERESLIASYEGALLEAGGREKEARQLADSLLRSLGRATDAATQSLNGRHFPETSPPPVPPRSDQQASPYGAGESNSPMRSPTGLSI